MHTRTTSTGFGITRTVIAVAVLAWLSALGAYLGGALALSTTQFSTFTTLSTVVFAGLAVSYEPQP